MAMDTDAFLAAALELAEQYADDPEKQQLVLQALLEAANDLDEESQE